MFDQRERLGDAAFAFLVCVIQMFQSKRFAVAEQPEKIAGGIAAGDDHDVVIPAFTSVWIG